MIHLEVRDLESPHRVHREDQGLVRAAPPAAPSQVVPQVAERTKDPRPIEPLTLTVFAVIHRLIHASNPRPPPPGGGP
jgi:hypothetical protein